MYTFELIFVWNIPMTRMTAMTATRTATVDRYLQQKNNVKPKKRVETVAQHDS
jgi:hypothetical protein